ncbi:MAG: hypothetical protein H6546_02700 [Chitinophagales bacterium]|nr:hypothetical protein [Chitinophagales bacterium]
MVPWYLRPPRRLWLDIDGVLADFEKHFLDKLKLQKGPSNDWNDPRFRTNFDKIANDEEFWATVPLLNGPDTFTYPIAGYCTARPINDEVTQQWLDQRGFPRAPLINVGQYGNKGKILHQKGCDVFIDDSFSNFTEVSMWGIECYLYTRPHNKKYKEVVDRRINHINQLMAILKDGEPEPEDA